MGQPEVTDFRASLLVEQDIARFDVPMDDAVLVRMGETGADFGDQSRRFAALDRLAVGRMIQRLPRHEFHDDEEDAIHFAEVIDPDEIRVVQPVPSPWLPP